MRVGSHQGELERLFESVGLADVTETALPVSVEHPTFEEWWDPFTLGVGPAGVYVAGLDPENQAKLREQCRAMLPAAPFVLTARAWAAFEISSRRAWPWDSPWRPSSPRSSSSLPSSSCSGWPRSSGGLARRPAFPRASRTSRPWRRENGVSFWPAQASR